MTAPQRAPAFARTAFELARETFTEFGRHKSTWLAAAIAYFTMFAIAPLVIVVVEIAGVVLGKHAAVLDELYGYLARSAGPSAAKGIQDIVTATLSQHRSNLFAQIAGWAVFVFGAIGLFSSLQDALNTVWDVPETKGGILHTIRSRLLSFGIVLCVAFVLLISVGLNSVIAIAGASTARFIPALPAMIGVADAVVSFVLAMLVFSILYSYLPDRPIPWRDVWLGAAVSAVLFVAGQAVLSWYLSHAGLSSIYGSFGGVIVFLVWVYYSAQLLLIGAEFTHVYSKRFGSARL